VNTAREMLDFVQGRDRNRFVPSPVFTDVYTQWLHGHEWLLASNDPRTIEDIVGVGRECGFVPFFEVLWFEVGLLPYDEVREETTGDTKRVTRVFRTPRGEHCLVDDYHRRQSRHTLAYAFHSVEDLDAYEYVAARTLDRLDAIRPALRAVIQQTGDRALPYFTVTTPYKCFSLISSQDLALLLMDAPDRMMEIARMNERITREAIRIAAECGFKVFFAGTESSLFSPELVENYCVRFLVERRRLIRDLGGVFYLHECGRMKDLIRRGVYARLGPEILEGFQPPPSGDVEDMAEAAVGLPAGVVTKGNLDLNFLRDRLPGEVYDACHRVLGRMEGRRHLMGGSCSLLPGTPLDNLRALVRATRDANADA
jgi:hypothetical protein